MDTTSAETADETEALRRQLSETGRRAESLRRVIELISGELELPALLTQIIDSAVELTGAEYGTVGLVVEHADGQIVQTAAVVNIPALQVGGWAPLGVGLSGHVLRMQAPVHLVRYDELPNITVTELRANTVVGIPIWWGRRVVGVLCIGARPPHRFSDDDVAMLIALARHAAIAIENARLFEAERRRGVRTALINQVARLIAASLSVDELFVAALEAICRSFNFRYIAAAIIDPEDSTNLIQLAETGADAPRLPAGQRQTIDGGLVGEAARSRQRVLSNNLEASPERYAKLVMPIVVADRLIGVITIEADRPLDEEEAESVAIIADQFGAALENARLFGGLQRALETTRLLFEVSQRLGAAMSVEQVVAAYLGEVAARGRYICTVALYEFDNQDQRSAVVVHGFWRPQDGVVMGQQRVPHSRDALDEYLDRGETVTISDTQTDLRVSAGLRELQARDGRPALAFIPLLARGRRLGLVILSYTQVHTWPAAELRLYQTTASQLASAIDSRLQHELAAGRANQVAVLEERRRLARELHDSVTQSLFSMSLLAQVLPDLWRLDREAAQQSLEQVRDLTRGALAEMRDLLYELRPAEAGEQDLAQGLRTRAGAFQRRSGVTASVQAPLPVRLPAEQAQALLRIVQEALTNIDHHARARSVSLAVRGGPQIMLRIADDGCGFVPNQVVAGRLGLISMRERAKAIGAELELISAPGQGTTITVIWPAVLS